MTSYLAEPLDLGRQDLSTFRCGAPALDLWLRQHAADAESRRVARTFVWVDGESILGYYALTGHVLDRERLPKSLGHGSPREVPAVLLARLAIAADRHGQGLGGALLADALRRVVDATRIVAARFAVVDAIDESVVAFYEHHGFRRVPGTLRLVQKVSDIAKALGS